MDPITLSLAKAYTEATAEGMGAVQGKPGPQGPVGPTGPQGPTGPAGPTGAKGEPGTNGVSPTVSVSPNSSNDGTVVTITDVNGTKSFEVLNGENGENGAPGPQGIPGTPGTPGATGPAGPQGAQGIQGNPGEPFLIYKVYPTKADMDSGYATDGLQEGQLVGISTVTGGDDGGHLYIKGATAYEFFFDLATVDGIAGPTGPQGVQGPEGPQGPAGQTGAPGTNGADGEDGATFTPSVSADGTLSWTNDGDLPNPAPVNIKGPAGATEEPFITIKDKTIGTPASLIAILGRNSYTGCVHAINSSIIETSFENDIVWLSFGLILGTYYLTLITIDGYLTEAETTGGSSPFDITNSTTFVREDQLDLANGTYFLDSWTEAPVVSNEYTVDISSFVGRKPVVSGQYVGTVRHDSANTLYDVSVSVMSIVDAAITVKIIRSTSFSSQGGGTDLTAGDGLTIADGVASVDTPVRGILTQSEFDALPEAEQSKGMYVILDSGSNGIKININGKVADVNGGSGGIVNWENIDGRPDLSNVSTLKAVSTTLSADLWDENNKHQILISDILADETAQLITPIPKAASFDAYYENDVRLVSQAEGALIFEADAKPVDDIDIIVYIQSVANIEQIQVSFVWWSPRMTSNITPLPYKAAASSIYYAQSDAYHAFDDSIQTWWHESRDAGSTPQWISFDFGEKTYVKGIRMYRRPNANTLKDLPHSFIIQGSDDGINWNDVLNVTDAPDVTDANTPREHMFSFAAFYKQYRLYDLIGSVGYRSIAEIEFYVSEVYANEH